MDTWLTSVSFEYFGILQHEAYTNANIGASENDRYKLQLLGSFSLKFKISLKYIYSVRVRVVLLH